LFILAAEAIEECDRLKIEARQKDAALAEAAPKAEALDRIAQSHGSVCLRLAAKLLQMREKDFLSFAQAERFIYRHPLGRHWLGYAERVREGLVEHKLVARTREDGSARLIEQALITRAGIAKLAERLERRRREAAVTFEELAEAPR
jgi:phage antirepressor YoqD-like protein